MKEIVFKTAKTAGNILVMMTIMVIAQLAGNMVGGFVPIPLLGECAGAVAYVSIALLLGLAYARYVLHIGATELGVKKNMPDIRWLLVGIALPSIVSLFYLVCTEGQLIRKDSAPEALSTIAYAVFTVGVGGGIVEEFIFRGLIMRMMEKNWGKVAAIFVPSLLFGLSHLANLPTWHLLDALLLIAAGTMVGVMFSIIAYYSKSIWSSALVHGLWNMIIIGGILEIGSLDFGMSADSIWQYQVSAKSLLLTGGQFGIEAALPAIVGYGVVSVAAVYICKKADKSVLG